MREVVSVASILLAMSSSNAAEPAVHSPLDKALRERCEKILRAALQSDEFWPSMHAAEALTLGGHGRDVLGVLAKRSESDDQKRCGLARESVRAGDRTKLDVLFAILDKPGSNGHTHAAESLFKMAEVGTGEKLRAALSQETDIRLKLMAAAALARCGHPTALDVPRKYLTNSDPEFRKVAAWILGQLGEPADAKAIAAAFEKETDPLAKSYGVNARALLRDASARKQLVANLAARDPAVRTYAAEFAGYSRLEDAQVGLVKLLDDPVTDVRVRAAQSLIVLSLPANVLGLPVAAGRPIIVQDVFPATRSNPRYSEGSVVTLTDGSLLYTTTEFFGGAGDDAKARIVARNSRDAGRTWGKARILQENIGKQNVMSVTLRRLTPHANSGPLGLFYLIKNGPADLKVTLRISDDEAKTFGEPICVTRGSGYHVMNNDRVTVLSTGRIVCPVAWAADIAKRGHFVSLCFYSDDGGKTWKKGTDSVDAPKRGAMEPEVIELARNKLLMIVRTQMGYIATSMSKDGGDHWGEPGRFTLRAPEAPATIRRIPATGDLLLVWNNNFEQHAGHGGKRTPLTSAVSPDGGRTWKHLRNLETDTNRTFAYTSITFDRDRVVLTYYVADAKSGRLSSRLRSLPVSWLYEAR